jgi:hypothetical protein
MVGDAKRREFAGQMREAVDKAGVVMATAVGAALALGAAAVLLSMAVLVFAVRTRRA